jgi:hypothetical protein
MASWWRAAVVVADTTWWAGLFQLVAPDARAGDPAPHSAIVGARYHGRGPVASYATTGSGAVAPIYRDGEPMHSQEETFRGTVRVRDLNGEPHTLIVLRRYLDGRARVWLTLNGAWKTTVCMTDPEVVALCELLTKAQHAGAR